VLTVNKSFLVLAIWFCFLWWGETETTWYVSHSLAYCTSLGWQMICVKQPVEWEKHSEKTCPSATLTTRNLTWQEPASNPGRRGGKPATNCLSYGTAHLSMCSSVSHSVCLSVHLTPPPSISRFWPCNSNRPSRVCKLNFPPACRSPDVKPQNDTRGTPYTHGHSFTTMASCSSRGRSKQSHSNGIIFLFLIIFLSSVRLSPLRTAAITGLLYQLQMIDDRDCEAIGGMKIGRGNRSTCRKPVCLFVHHKSHMTKRGPPLWEASG
jgi:hypothetical protein